MIKPLAITTGEPAGIGMDIVLDSFIKAGRPRHWQVLADTDALSVRADLLNLDIKFNTSDHYLSDDSLWVKHLPCNQSVVAGELNPANAAQVLAQLSQAHALAMSGEVSAIVTAPLQKSIINQAIQAGLAQCELPGGYFPGHTEFFEHLSGSKQVVMMLANSSARVALVTTHLPLRAVPDAITDQKLTRILDVLLSDLRGHFGINDPQVFVCGLNPHAGEGGHMGLEEIEVINPVLKRYQAQGFSVSSALPADTLFTPKYLAQADAFLAMYHDQGLTAVKTLGFGETVNITLGLPYIRTSVDHGTALDLAGSGQASSSSFLAAIQMADNMAEHKN